MEIEQLRWRPDNEAKLAAHGITRGEVEEVIDRDEWVIDKHPRFPNQVRMIGPTSRRRFLTIVLEETDVPTVWRPVTGWDADDDEMAYYLEEGR